MRISFRSDVLVGHRDVLVGHRDAKPNCNAHSASIASATDEQLQIFLLCGIANICLICQNQFFSHIWHVAGGCIAHFSEAMFLAELVIAHTPGRARLHPRAGPVTAHMQAPPVARTSSHARRPLDLHVNFHTTLDVDCKRK